MSYRDANGKRRHKTGGTSGQRPDGSTICHPSGTLDRAVTEIANPGNLIRTKTGGGHLGDAIAHDNEAPFPEKLVEFFLRSLCPKGGTVLDPFSGSGTTAKVATVTGRNAIAIDIRSSQTELTAKRLSTDLARVRELF